MKNRRTFVLAPLGAVAVVLAFTSLAYACTLIGGQTTVSPNEGSPGATISVGGKIGTDSRQKQAHEIRFLNYQSEQDSMKTCMNNLTATHPDVALGGKVSPDSAGNFPTVDRTIPTDIHPGLPLVDHGAHNSTSTTGPALVCHMTPDVMWATKAASVTIVGGAPDPLR